MGRDAFGVELDGVSAQDAGGVLLFVVHPGEERFEASANGVKWVATSNTPTIVLPYSCIRRPQLR